MSRMILSLSSLSEFDEGVATTTWMKALERAILDCRKRPTSKKPRSITFKTFIEPILSPGSEGLDNTQAVANEVKITFEVSSSNPPSRTTPRPMAITNKNQLFFNSLDPNNPNQLTVDDVVSAADN